MEASNRQSAASHLSATTFWVAAIAATVAGYWLALRWMHPGYFAPLTPFHIDFYDYVGMCMKPISRLLSYPRPVAYITMHLMGAGGLNGLMGASIALALVNMLLTIAYVRRIFDLYSPWSLLSAILYLVLNFAHPDFYFEHRHDLPAQVSYFGLIVALLVWDSLLQSRSRGWKRAVILPALAVLLVGSCICFAFCKETYFVSALCLVVALLWSQPRKRYFHLGFLVFLVAIEVASFLWTRHVQSPFVNLNAAADSTYRIDLSPISVVQTFAFYAYHLVNPGIFAIVLWVGGFAWRHSSARVLAVAFPLAGLAAFAPHSILPNHRFEEYAWVAAPLFLAPVLLLGAGSVEFVSRRVQAAVAVAFFLLALFGPWGYQSGYESEEVTYLDNQERYNGALLGSFARLNAFPADSRVLITGLEEPMVPWRSADFVRSRFGEKISWTLLIPAWSADVSGSRWTSAVRAPEVELSEFDYIAAYHPTGELISIQPARAVIRSNSKATVLAPALTRLIAATEARPADYRPLLDCAAEALTWGLVPEALEFLHRAKGLGGESLPEYRDLANRAARLTAQSPKPATATLIANPATIMSADSSGLGATELFWKISDGLFVELHVDAPDGPLFASSSRSGSASTDRWVRDGTQFFLQDVTGGKPLTAANTLAAVKVSVSQ